LKEASSIIRRHVRAPIANAVYREDFEEIVPGSFAKFIGGAYGFCAYNTLHAIRSYCEKINYKDPINFVFEKGARGEGQVRKWYDKMRADMCTQRDFRLGSYTTGDKRMRPLQAADFLAYGLGRYALDHEAGTTRMSVIGHLRDILGEKEPDNAKVIFWDRSSLEKLANDLAKGGFEYWQRSTV
jgi:hypothetical protein